MEAKYPVDQTDIIRVKNNFSYHKVTQEQAERIEHVRHLAQDFASHILTFCPPSRERSLALTELEEASFWTSASIARNEPAEPKKEEPKKAEVEVAHVEATAVKVEPVKPAPKVEPFHPHVETPIVRKKSDEEPKKEDKWPSR